jgi:hypothetical protein
MGTGSGAGTGSAGPEADPGAGAGTGSIGVAPDTAGAGAGSVTGASCGTLASLRQAKLCTTYEATESAAKLATTAKTLSAAAVMNVLNVLRNFTSRTSYATRGHRTGALPSPAPRWRGWRLLQQVASILTCPWVDTSSANQTMPSSRSRICIMRCGSPSVKPSVAPLGAPLLLRGREAIVTSPLSPRGSGR